MYVVTEADAAAIREVYGRDGELSAAIELRRRFQGISDNEQARAFARIIANWKPLPPPSELPPRRSPQPKSRLPARPVSPLDGLQPVPFKASFPRPRHHSFVRWSRSRRKSGRSKSTSKRRRLRFSCVAISSIWLFGNTCPPVACLRMESISWRHKWKAPNAFEVADGGKNG
jgi:hypothetical protein